MLSNLNPKKKEDFIEDIALAILGAPQSGKTSLANALLGFNEERSDEYN